MLFTYRLGCALFALSLFALPILFLVKENDISAQAVWVTIAVLLTMAGTSTMFTLVSIFILVNNSCYSHERATVNGIGQVFVSLARLCAPFIVSQMVAHSSKGRTDWLIYYTILGAATMMNSRLALLLPRSIERRRREPMEPRYAHSTAEDYDEDCSELEDLIPGGEMPSPPHALSPRIENKSHIERDRERDRDKERERDKPNGIMVGTSSSI